MPRPGNLSSREAPDLEEAAVESTVAESTTTTTDPFAADPHVEFWLAMGHPEPVVRCAWDSVEGTGSTGALRSATSHGRKPSSLALSPER
jgi:hypothetical protein